MKVHTFHFAGVPAYHPDEDATVWRDNRFAVFDGVTLAYQHPYPNPSPAAEAARRGCEAVLTTPLNQEDPKQALRAMTTAVTKAVKQLNDELGLTKDTVDFLGKQYAATVGAYGFIQDNTLYCAQLADCEVMVIGPTGDIKFRLENIVGPLGKYMEQVRAQENFSPNGPEEHRYVRKNVINNLHLAFDQKPIRIGVFTGEAAAEQFVHEGHYALEPQDTVLFFSDGMLPFVGTPAFRIYLAKDDLSGLEAYQQTFDVRKSERSLLVVKPAWV